MNKLYGLLRRPAAVAGIVMGGFAIASIVLTEARYESSPPASVASLNQQLQLAAREAQAYQQATGKWPDSIDNLRGFAAQAPRTRRFTLDGSLYIQVVNDGPRLSWRDAYAAAYCPLKAALSGHCA